MTKNGTDLDDLKFDDTIHSDFYSRNQYSTRDWEQLSVSVNDLISTLSQDYLWNRDDFRVCCPLQLDGNNSIQHLTSITCYGDNIEDEWFIVYLIYEITRLKDDLIVRVEDNDGCFLLIEAADYLPDWLSPENADCRIFIYQNNLHIISPELASIEEDTLDIYKSIWLIVDNAEKTKASPAIQAAIRRRINGYPQKIKENLHKAIVSLPIQVASILKLQPSLISQIVNSYCNHDIFDAKICRSVNYTDCIDVQITFTKFLYAMLMNSKIVRDLQTHIPQNDRKKNLGLKLTCGYEIIMNQSTNVFVSREYKTFFNSLKKSGYFKHNIEGSKEFNQLLERANSYFLTMECSLNTNTYNKITSLMGGELYQTMKDTLLNSNSTELSEDNDDWLNISPNQLDDLLTNQFGSSFSGKNASSTSQNVASALTEFLNRNSDFEGIEQSQEFFDPNKIELDPEEFATCLEKFLNIVTSNEDLELTENSDNEEVEDDSISQEIEKELHTKLCHLPKNHHNTVKDNLVQSMKEEGISGPSSNILKTIGIKKTDLLDSDDDNE